MKIKLKKNDLFPKLQIINSIISSKSIHDKISNILVECLDNSVKITSTDMELTVISKIPAIIEEAGTISLPGRKLIDIVRELPDMEISFSLQGTMMDINCGKSFFKLVTSVPESFLNIPEYSYDKEVTIRSDLFYKCINKTFFSISLDDARPNLNGALLEVNNSGFSIITTDSYRLTRIERKDFTFDGIPFELIIPLKTLNILLKVLSGSSEELKIKIGNKSLSFELSDFIMHSKILEGPFPNYKKVIPKNTKKLVVKKQDFTEVLRRIVIMSNQNTHQIYFSLSENNIKVSVNTPELGEAVEDIEAQYGFEEMEISYNANYLLEILKHIETDNVLLTLEQPNTAGIIVPDPGDDMEDYFCLIMPLRIED